MYDKEHDVREINVAHAPIYIWLLVGAGVAGIPAWTAVGLFRSARDAGRATPAAAAITATFAAGWAAVIAACVALAAAGAFDQSAVRFQPWFGVFAAGVLLAALAATAIPAVAAAIRTPSAPARLTWPQTFRVAGVAILLMMVLGHLPAVFALPAGLGDIAVGVAAPTIARRLARGDRRGAANFHVLGITDLTVAVTTAVFAAQGPTGVLDVQPSTADISLLPLVLIPLTAVPLALTLHVTALRRLLRAERPQPLGAAQPAIAP